jgi:hypothetical protein
MRLCGIVSLAIGIALLANDDPAGSPTWSAYKQFKTGDFSARAFRFRIELQSTSDDVTPSIDELSAKVRYG